MRLNLYGTSDQKDIVTCNASEIFVAAGRRWGKNFGVRNRHLYKVTGKAGFQYLHAAPSYAQVQAEWEKVISLKQLRPLIKSYSKKDPYPRIDWINGSQSHFRSLERADNLRNGEYDEAAIDESQDVDEDDIKMVVEPMLASRFGTLIMFGQFRGHDWRYENYYLPGQDKDNDDVMSWRFPSSSGVVFQSEKGRKRLARLKATTPRMVWEQEWDCIPSANSSGVFRASDIDRSTKGGIYQDSGAGRYVAGLDLGMFEDPAGFVVIDVENPSFCYEHLFEVGQPHEKTAQQVGALAARFGNPTVVMDSTGGATGGHHKHDEFTQHYEKLVPNLRPYYWNITNKNKAVNKLSLAIEKNELGFAVECETLIKEMKTYEYRKRPNGSYEFNGPKGKNDNLVASALLAHEGYSRGWAKSGNSVAMSSLVSSIGG
jgi:hypothetical protein